MKLEPELLKQVAQHLANRFIKHELLPAVQSKCSLVLKPLVSMPSLVLFEPRMSMTKLYNSFAPVQFMSAYVEAGGIELTVALIENELGFITSSSSPEYSSADFGCPLVDLLFILFDISQEERFIGAFRQNDALKRLAAVQDKLWRAYVAATGDASTASGHFPLVIIAMVLANTTEGGDSSVSPQKKRAVELTTELLRKTLDGKKVGSVDFAAGELLMALRNLCVDDTLKGIAMKHGAYDQCKRVLEISGTTLQGDSLREAALTLAHLSFTQQETLVRVGAAGAIQRRLDAGCPTYCDEDNWEDALHQLKIAMQNLAPTHTGPQPSVGGDGDGPVCLIFHPLQEVSRTSLSNGIQALNLPTSPSVTVADASVVVVGLSDSFQRSAECRKQLLWASELGRHVVGIKYEAGFTLSGWCKVLISDAPLFDASADDASAEPLAIEAIAVARQRAQQMSAARQSVLGDDGETPVPGTPVRRDSDKPLTPAELKWATKRLSKRQQSDKATMGGAAGSDERLVNLDLCDAQLQDGEFTAKCFDGASLSRADLQRARLNSARMRFALFDGANMTETSLEDADLTGARISTASLVNAKAFGATFSGANFVRADLSHAILEQTNLSQCSFKLASLHEANLEGAMLDGATFVGANLTGARLNAAHLQGAPPSPFHGAQVDGMVLKDAILPDWSHAELMRLKGSDEIAVRLRRHLSYAAHGGWCALFTDGYAAYRTPSDDLSRSQAELALLKEMITSLYRSEVSLENWQQAISPWMALCAQQHRCTLRLAQAVIHEATMQTVDLMLSKEKPEDLVSGKGRQWMLSDDTTGFRRLLELKALLDGAEGSDELLAAQLKLVAASLRANYFVLMKFIDAELANIAGVMARKDRIHSYTLGLFTATMFALLNTLVGELWAAIVARMTTETGFSWVTSEISGGE